MCPLVIPNTTVNNANYDTPRTFKGNDIFASGYFTIANNPVQCQIFMGLQGLAQPIPEQYLPPGTYQIVSNPKTPFAGLRVKRGATGVDSQIFGAFWYPHETVLQGGNPFTTLVSASGNTNVQPQTLDCIVVSFSAQQSIPNGALTALNFNTTSFVNDPLALYTLAANQVTVAKAGLYRVTIQVAYVNFFAQEKAAGFSKNAITLGANSTFAANAGCAISTDIVLAVNDTLGGSTYQAQGVAQNTSLQLMTIEAISVS